MLFGLRLGDRLGGPIVGSQDRVFQNAKLSKWARNLKGSSKAFAANLVGCQPSNRLAIKHNLALAGLIKPGDDVKGGAFTRAIGTNKAQDFTLSQLETDPINRGEAPEALGQRPD